MSDTQMTPARLAEIRDLLKYESSIAFYSSRAKESMLLLVAEAEDAARLREQVTQVTAEVERFGIYGSATVATKALVERASELVDENAKLQARIAELEKDSATLAALEAAGVDNWEGYSDAFAGDES